MTTAKNKIKNEVRIWKTTNPREFELFKIAFRQRRGEDVLETKWAEVKGTDYLERHMYSLPETLSQKILMVLDDEENKWLSTKKGAEWMVRTFPVFSATHKA